MMVLQQTDAKKKIQEPPAKRTFTVNIFILITPPFFKC